ncbi:ribosomal L1 domain-containing protein 1 isoform X1 [Conger conger]|uniref:ribosomal L1 domain-containing protein 1 isoform X1 n=1 Tax=Conger conger TaxID=82655 RepID=UPI002A5B01C1|nr:ribosomal L1 domain-containing protein 1 isoform X1 [Conger conger]
MASDQDEVMLDQAQVKKAVQALQAYLKSTSTSESLLLNESQHISLLFTLWRIPKKEQTIRIPLPHGMRTDTAEVCLFTKDEPNMTGDQTERFYKKLLTVKGVERITEVIPFKVLKTEYKPFEAKRRLLGNFDLFLADSRIYRLLPSHIGKHFYESKKAPLSVDLQSNQLARDLQRLIQGSALKVSKKGSCCMARVAHSGMTADEVVENIMAAVSTIASKLPLKGQSIKIIHLKSQSSVALPIYTSNLSHQVLVEEAAAKTDSPKKAKNKAKKKQVQHPAGEKQPSDEEIPQLVPIVSPSKKAKLETPCTEGLEKAPKSPRVKANKKSPSSRRPSSQANSKPGTPATKAPKGGVPGEGLKQKTPKMGRGTPGKIKSAKLAKSAKKAPKTPTQKRIKKVPQSC